MFAAFGAVLLSAAIIAPTILLTDSATADTGPKMEEMVVIEASLAMRKNPKQPTQPQKDRRPPDETKKPEGVSRDENKKVDDKKKDDKKPDPKEPEIDLTKPLPPRPRDDQETGAVTEPFNPNESTEVGRDAVTKGDPYLGKLKNDMNYQPPEIAKGDSIPVGCIHLQPDGKIVETKFKQKTDDDLQTAAEAALKQLVETRNRKPEEVPPHLLSLTSKWLCFNFSVKPS